MKINPAHDKLTAQLKRLGGQPDFGMIEHRARFCREFCFTVPDPRTLEFIEKHLPKQPVLDPMAGTGYWAWMLSQLGFEVKASDLFPVDCQAKNFYHPGLERPYYPVALQDAKAAVLDCVIRNTPHTVVLSWVPYEDTVGEELLELTKATHILYIGEERGGCCGTDKMFDILESKWRLLHSHRPWQFPGIHDYVSIWERC